MFAWGGATHIYLAAAATDLCKGFDGLHALVSERLEMDPLSGHVFVFANRARTWLRILFWDGSGLWPATKRLERGRLGWPAGQGENKLRLSPDDLAGRAGLTISRASLDGWVMRVGELLTPVTAAMRQELLAGGYIQADATPVDVQMHDGGSCNGRGWLWQRSRSHGPVLFDFRRGRSRDGPRQFLAGFREILQTDGYAAYEQCNGPGIVPAACWARGALWARRKFYEAANVAPPEVLPGC